MSGCVAGAGVRRWLIVLVGLAAWLAVGARPVAAVPQTDPYLILSGSSGAVDWTIRAPVRLALVDDAPYVDDEVRARLGGDYAGFMISTSTGRYVAGAFLVRGMLFQDKYKTLLWLGPAKPSLTLPPGKYRVRLVADKPSTLALRIAAGARGSVALRTSGPAGNVSAQRLDLRAPGTDVYAPVARGTTTIQVRKNQWLLAAAFEERRTASAQEVHICVSRGGRCLPILDDTASFSGSGSGPGAITFTAWWAPGALAAATYDVAFTLDSTGLPDKQIAFVIAVS